MTEQNPYAYKQQCFLCQETFTFTGKRIPSFCPECRRSPLYQVALNLHGQVRRAEKADLPATVTFAQWLSTLDFFEGMCAYCQVIPYKCIDHFFPFELGGGTTWNNIAPACHGCNHRKGSKLPEDILQPTELVRVRTYLFMRAYVEEAV
jgi:5-methylcytosine-specific restriction endonuclease McrA